ncbi:MAG TPA: bifunctional transaldolase/phosoglucose isomerase [Candidatus Acidoferrum sp.]|nr:bifunctional transaldolase/phosoglucose isomerase [Candidatus Acidoferrum sp.]
MSVSAKSTTPAPGPAPERNHLKELQEYGQSVWLDYIRRSLITTGELARLVREDGLRGLTSNPTIFEKAISGSTDYTRTLDGLSGSGLDANATYERLAIKDIQDAADLLRPVYDETNGRDGYVSFEVSPYLAHKTQETIAEARRLWKTIGRANAMIKVPGTVEGIPAFRHLISEGINVNVTLLFAQEVYEEVAEAYIAGLEERVTRGGDVSRVASVASFFISRIDSLIDAQIAARLKSAQNSQEQATLRSLQGKVAIANGKLTYQRYEQIFAGPRWRALADRGAQTQRILWASTSTKNPAYSDVLYVDELIGPDTVNTIPPATYDAFREHGHPRASLEEGIDAARATMETLARVGISMKAATDQLTQQGVKLFEESFDQLLAAVGKRSAKNVPGPVASLTYKLPSDLAQGVRATIEDWKKNNKVQRLWARDASLWTNTDECKWLGWLAITEDQIAHRDQFEKIAEEIRSAGFTHALLLGMGGSSLCVEVLKMTFGKVSGRPEVLILDSTDPAQVRAVENQIDVPKTIFIVSSKSGSTLEPNIFKQHFFDRAKRGGAVGGPGKQFIAITDPGSKMQQVAEADGFRYILFGVPTIGGRYSALSSFGMIPGAIQGLDIPRFLGRAEEMVHACGSVVPADENPGAILGAVLGTAQKAGRDKVTLFTSPGISDLGAWLEQLLAESTGKEGKGLIPVDREAIGPPNVYGQDRVFVYLRLETAPDAKQDGAVAALEQGGHPVVRIAVRDVYDVGQEFFRWEFATAVAGSVIGINAFNQPDVEASKVETRKLTDEYEKTGALPPEAPFFADKDVRLFADEKNAAALKAAAGGGATLGGYVRAHLNRLHAGDYFALLGYIQMSPAHEEQLQEIRHSVRDKKHVATCVGFGPRFLHSTGQAYKGGPNSGVFLQITCDDAADLPVPGQKYTFGIVKAAQARGDFQVLAERGRRALRVHVGTDVAAGLAKLDEAIRQALS